MPRPVKSSRRAPVSAARIETVRKPSRQREYQLRHAKKGLCTKCKNKAVNWGLCRKHERKQIGYQFATKQRKLAAFGKAQ